MAANYGGLGVFSRAMVEPDFIVMRNFLMGSLVCISTYLHGFSMDWRVQGKTDGRRNTVGWVVAPWCWTVKSMGLGMVLVTFEIM